MTQGAGVLFVAAPAQTRERLAGVLGAVGHETILADTLVEARRMLAGREVALVAARLDPASEPALAFARDISPRIPLLALLDRPETMKRFLAAGVRLDDAIFAPFADAEITARIDAALARRGAAFAPPARPATLTFSGWSLDIQAKSLTDTAGRDVHLTPAEFLLLEALLRRSERVQSREQLLDAIAGGEAAPFDRTIDNLVCRLRRKIEDDPACPRLIVTVPRFGYRFNAEPDGVRAGAPSIRRSSAEHPAMVVLPFRADDEASETPAACFSEDLVAELARASDARVIAGSLAMRQAVQQLGPGTMSRELGARYMITGSVRRDGPLVRISASLVDAATGTHLGAERASIAPGVPVCDQTGLDRIVHGLRRQVRIAEGVRSELAGEADAPALIARGRAILLQSDTLESRRMACRFFERALALDHGSVGALSGLGATIARNVVARWSAEPLADQRRAEKLLQQALRAAPDDFDANFGMGMLLRWQGHPGAAAESLERSTEIDRANPNALIQLGLAHIFLGHPEEALPHMERAACMGGSSSTVSTAYWALGSCYLFLGNREEALAWLLKARAKNWTLPWVRLRLAAALGQVGERNEARGELEAARSLVAPARRADYATLAVFRAQPQLQHPEFLARNASALYVGLGKAGMPGA